MHRVTITIDDELMNVIDGFMRERGYQNRSEAIRDLTRAGITQQNDLSDQNGDCVAAVVYVYDHDARDLPKRLARTFHHHHDLSLSTLHVHLDHSTCLEVTMLRGPADQVRQCADHVIAERGVRHGRIVIVPISADSAGSHHSHPHSPGDH